MPPTRRSWLPGCLCWSRRSFEQNSITAEVGPDSSLVDIGLTSMDMVNLMLGVEAEFDAAIAQSEVTPENFQSTLERMIVSQLQPASSGRSNCRST